MKEIALLSWTAQCRTLFSREITLSATIQDTMENSCLCSVVFSLILIAYCCASSDSISTSKLLFAFKNIVQTIRQTFQTCRNFNYIHESHSTFLYSSSLIAGDRGAGVNLILDLISPGFSLDSQQLFRMPPVTHQYTFRNHQPCSVIFFELDLLLGDMYNLSNHTIGNRWPERFLRSLPNTVDKTFFIFFTLKPELDSELDGLIIYTAQILHFVFVMQDSNETHVVKGMAQPEQSLRVVATISSDNFEIQQDSELFYTKCPDLMGQTIISITCMICKSENQDLIKAGMADEPFTYAWTQLQKSCNASVVFELVFEAPGLGVRETGAVDEYGEDVLEWDELMVGIAEGSAGFTVPITNSPYVQHVAWLTRPILYDGLYFVTAQPKLSEADSILVLCEPLELEVWLGFLISLFVITILLQFVVESKSSSRRFWVVIDALLRLSISQPCVVNAKSLIARILLGLWLMFIILIGCGYSSKFITTIAFPTLVNPPRTFDELAASDYEVGMILHNVLMQNTDGLGKSALTLLQRVKLLEFSEAQSYRMIFEGRKACMGPWKAINKFGIKFMVDIDGNRMYRRSEDVLAFGYAQVAISRHYPMFFEPMDKWMALADQSGMTTFVREVYYDRRATKTGQEFSRNVVKFFPYYQRKRAKLSQDDRLIRILARLMMLGFGASVLAFFKEICPKTCKLLNNAWNLLKYKMVKREQLGNPEHYWAYENELYSYVRRKNWNDVPYGSFNFDQ